MKKLLGAALLLCGWGLMICLIVSGVYKQGSEQSDRFVRIAALLRGVLLIIGILWLIAFFVEK